MSRRQIFSGRDVLPELTRPGTHHNDVARRHSHPPSPKRAPSSPFGPIRCQSLRPSSLYNSLKIVFWESFLYLSRRLPLFCNAICRRWDDRGIARISRSLWHQLWWRGPLFAIKKFISSTLIQSKLTRPCWDGGKRRSAIPSTRIPPWWPIHCDSYNSYRSTHTSAPVSSPPNNRPFCQDEFDSVLSEIIVV